MKNCWSFPLTVLGLAGVFGLLLSGCAGTPKVSRWVSPSDLALKRVFDAALL